MFGQETDKRCLEVKSFVLKQAIHLHNCYGTEPTLLGERMASISSWSLADRLHSGGSIFRSLYIEDIQDILQMTNLIFEHELEIGCLHQQC